ncbi:MAG: hypothetical protein Q9O74_06830 [Planctomycetota bacterium]|nr:hypothetical protein [Planctomycetota bacterium]
MFHHRYTVLLALGSLAVAGLFQGSGCAGTGGGGGGGGGGSGAVGGLHFPRPSLYAARATLPVLSGPATTADSVRVEFLAANSTGAPLWLRRMSITLAVDESELAAGSWEGDRQIDPGTSLLLDISLPMVEGGEIGALVGVDASEGRLTVKARYARSGLLGLMGGESFTYTLPVVFLPASASEDARP